ncbi:DNA-directed RNA polymerase subunit P [Candidatus Woesearchaeota archaeon]|nr:DNA-directed RNA polymerase subunit P [Candidatus Woesearchaeota archaeon]
MVAYKCFRCSKEITKDLLGKRIRCPFCGSKIFYKVKTVSTKLKAL